MVRKYTTDDPVEPLRDEGNVPAYWIRPTTVLSNEAGMHRFVWDLHYALPHGMQGGFPIAAVYHNTARAPHGVWALPGQYTVKLTVDGKAQTQLLVVKMDPRVKTLPIVLQQQFSVSKRLADALDASANAIEEIRGARERLKQNAGPDAVNLDKQLVALQGQGGGGRGGGRGAAPGGEPSFSSVIGELSGPYSLIQGADVTPTSQALAAAERALTSFTNVMAKWTMVKAQIR